jgi:hypothetical protein
LLHTMMNGIEPQDLLRNRMNTIMLIKSDQ